MKTFLLWAACLACMISCLPSRSFAQATGTNVAVIDVNFIFKNHERFKEKMDDIRGEIAQYEDYLREQRTSITQQAEQLKGLPAGSAQYQQLEEQIASQHTQLQLKTGRKQKDILEREAKIYYHAYKEIEKQVQDFAYAHGILLVLRYSSEEMDPTKRDSVLQGVNRSVVFQNQRDITPQILSALNRGTPPPGLSRQQPQVPGRTAPTRR